MQAKRTAQRRVVKLRPAEPAADQQDAVLIEEPLELRIFGEPVAITMRTPGHDRELAAGFLLSEGLIASREDLASVAHCGRPGDEGFGNTLEVKLASGVRFDPERLALTRRGTVTTAACGICGRRSVEDLLKLCGEVPDGGRISSGVLASLPERLREAQPAFTATGGSHAAALFELDGTLVAAFEDVGRHNAVDKAIGAALLEGALPGGPPRVLVISGRASFEILQKAAVAKLPIVAAVSAASALAIELADRAHITLAAFVRGGGLNLYAHPHRVAVDP